MTTKNIDGISAEAELMILRELERLGVLVTCATCGQCELPATGEAPRCITTVRGNGICGKSLVKA
jgi:hypothetical protein